MREPKSGRGPKAARTPGSNEDNSSEDNYREGGDILDAVEDPGSEDPYQDDDADGDSGPADPGAPDPAASHDDPADPGAPDPAASHDDPSASPDAESIFERFVFDEEFVRSAEISEPTAAERQRAIRQANLQRLLQDSDAQQENLLHEYRRFAPLAGDEDGSDFTHRDSPRSGDAATGDAADDTTFGNSGEGGVSRSGSGVFDADYGLDYDDLSPDHEDYELWIRQRRQRRNRRVLAMVSVVVIVSIVVVYSLSQFFVSLGLRDRNSASGSPSGNQNVLAPGARAPGDPEDADTGSASRPDDWPPVGTWALTPLGSPEPVPAGGGPHDFLMFQANGTSPVAYDPCRVVRYVTHGRGDAPDSADRLVDDAIATLAKLTGLVFVNDGDSDEGPSDTRAAYQPDRYGERWAPVLISWSTAAESPRLGVTIPEGAPPGSTLDVLGYAGSVSAGFTTKGSATVEADEPKGFALTDAAAGETGSGETESGDTRTAARTERIYVTGSVVLDRENFATMLGEFDGYARARATVLHELGHLVGLNHVDDVNQLMAPTLHSSLTEFAAGDREGLAALGTGACVPGI